MRIPALVFVAVLSIAAAPPAPAVLAPYIHEGRFDPGDYGWMKGRFSDASAADKEAHAQIEAWLEGCRQADIAQTTEELAQLGVTPVAGGCVVHRDEVCDAVSNAPRLATFASFAQITEALDRALPIADSYMAAVQAAEETLPPGENLKEALLVLTLGEQMLRMGMSGSARDIPAWKTLTPDEKAVILSRRVHAMAVRDRNNTKWLVEQVAQNGWPKISDVGERASGQAWLLVQHADADPPFQLRALRLMEPMTKTGEVSKRNYAYLYDRVMLKIAGKQRYATQMTCKDEKRVPLPLEDAASVEVSRKEIGLEPLSEYMGKMQNAYGDCPKG